MEKTKHKKTIIALTGMMGCGKTTTAAELAKYLPNFIRVEMDDKIENQEQMSINEIFEKKGEQYFRQIETKLLDELCKQQNLIISMGGGAFLSEENRNFLKQSTITFYLCASSNTIYNHIKDDNSRPLLKSENPKKRIKDILKLRENIYEKADYTIQTDNKNANEVAEEIMEIYTKYANRKPRCKRKN